MTDFPKREGGRRTRDLPPGKTPDLPLISVVTVVHNGAAHLEKAIASVLEQTYGNVEYLLVDGGSTDGTLDIIRRYEDRIDYWVSEPDRGIYDAMNKGIRLSRGELIGLLNSDDWYEPGALEAVAREYARHPKGSVALAGRWRMIVPGVEDPIEGKPSLKLHTGFPLLHQAMFIPRDVYGRIGLYNTGFRIAADFDMVARMVRGNIDFAFLDAVLVNYRIGGASTVRYREAIREGGKVLRKNQASAGTRFLYHLFMMRFAVLTGIANALEGVLGNGSGTQGTVGLLKRFYYRLQGRIPRGHREERGSPGGH